jgi:hypothetical protein
MSPETDADRIEPAWLRCANNRRAVPMVVFSLFALLAAASLCMAQGGGSGSISTAELDKEIRVFFLLGGPEEAHPLAEA